MFITKLVNKMLFNRNVFKIVWLSARHVSWCPNYLKTSGHQTVNNVHFSFTKILPLMGSTTYFQYRMKYDKSKKHKHGNEIDESSTNEFDETTDGKDTKITTTRVNSLRMDSIIKSALGLARNKVESAFFDSRIRVNGKKVLKKSLSLHVGDEVDVIKEISPVNNEHLIVTRIEILSATANEEDISVTLRRFKSLTIENYSGQNVYKSTNN